MHFPAVADMIIINSLYHSKVGAQWSKPKNIRGSSGARYQRLSQASSSKHSLPVSVFRNPLDVLGKGCNPTLQHLIIFQRISWNQISSNILHLWYRHWYMYRTCVFKNRSIWLVINYVILSRDTPAFRQENRSAVFHQQTASVWNVFYGLSVKKASLPSRVWMDKKPDVIGLKTWFCYYADVVVSIATSEKNGQVEFESLRRERPVFVTTGIDSSTPWPWLGLSGFYSKWMFR